MNLKKKRFCLDEEERSLKRITFKTYVLNV